MSIPDSWRVGVVSFGKVTRTSTLGHLCDDSGRTLCGAQLAAHVPAPETFIRCQRCIDARSRA